MDFHSLKHSKKGIISLDSFVYHMEKLFGKMKAQLIVTSFFELPSNFETKNKLQTVWNQQRKHPFNIESVTDTDLQLPMTAWLLDELIVVLLFSWPPLRLRRNTNDIPKTIENNRVEQNKKRARFSM